jgi:hypothetical protein
VNARFEFEDALGILDEVEEEPNRRIIDPAPDGLRFSLRTEHVHAVKRGVTVPWLVQAFNMKRANVVRMLEGCRSIGVAQGGQPVYDLTEAAARLVEPKVDLRRYLSNLDPKDLPESLRSEFWSSRIKEQKARRDAGDLWRSEDVLSLFAETFKRIKDRSLLWTDTVEATHGLTDEQRKAFIALKDDLLEDISVTVQQLGAGQTTLSQIVEFEDEDAVETEV